MTNRMLPRLVTSAILVLGLFVGSRVEAQSVYFNGFTNGAFCSTSNIGCVNPNTSLYQTATLIALGANGNPQSLRYGNATFSGTTSSGQLNLTGASQPWGTQNVNNFGAFYLTGGNVSYVSPFSLWITFINPATTTLAFSAMVTGTITAGNGTVTIDFNPNSQGMTWNSGNGWATVTVNDVGTPAEGQASVTGLITAQVTPEPITMSLVGTGLLGLAGMARRRRRRPAATA